MKRVISGIIGLFLVLLPCGCALKTAPPSVVTLPIVYYNNTGSYVPLTNANYASNSYSALLLPFIVILQQPQDQLILLGNSCEFTIQAIPAEATYQWRFKDVPMPGETNKLLKINNVNTNNLGEYDCLVTTEAETKISRRATLAGYFYTGPGITLIAYPPTVPPGTSSGSCPFPSVAKLRLPPGEDNYARKTMGLSSSAYTAFDPQNPSVTKIFYQGNVLLSRGCFVNGTGPTALPNIASSSVWGVYFMVHFPTTASVPTNPDVPYYLLIDGFQ